MVAQNETDNATVYVATPFALRTNDYVETSIFRKPSFHDLSHGSNFLPPPICIQEAISKASIWGRSMAQYDSPYGPMYLRELISEYESCIHAEKVNADNILITLGGVDGLSLYFRCRACEIITHSKSTTPTVLLIGPQYPTIARIAEVAGFKVAMTRHIDNNYLKISSTIIEWRPDTVLFTQPSNPFGTFMTEEDFGLLCQACSQIKSDIVIDKVCGDIPSEYYKVSPNFREIARSNGVRLTEIESYSKRRGIPGLRIGYNIMHQDFVHWCATAVTGRTVSSIGCAAVKCDVLSYLENDRDYFTQITRNHEIVVRNTDALLTALGSKLVNYSYPTNGANFLVTVTLPELMHESQAALWLHNAYHLGTYPVSCFELWPEQEALGELRIRITAATPQTEFDEAISILSSALSNPII